jgi:DNA-binding winged helix-turn-helix (wHTH) protein
VRVRFSPFVIDSDTRQLTHGDREIHLSPKAFDLLWFLIEHRPKVVDKGRLHAHIWPDTFVIDANLNVLVGEIRKALDEDARQPRRIRTAHGVGYAFSGEATEEAQAPAVPDSMLCWLTLKGTTFRLEDGDNVIGRGPRCAVFLDVDGVSRRHANIHIDVATRLITLADLGSTNGTFVRGSEVTRPVELHDGDVITVGSVDLRLRAWASGDGPKTKRLRRKPQ